MSIFLQAVYEGIINGSGAGRYGCGSGMGRNGNLKFLTGRVFNDRHVLCVLLKSLPGT